MAIKLMIPPDPVQAPVSPWLYLEMRPHPWRRQLSIKGRRLFASAVWSDMIANQLTFEEIAHSRDLPVEAVRECVKYCEENRSLLEDEAAQEKKWLLAQGVRLEPSPAD